MIRFTRFIAVSFLSIALLCAAAVAADKQPQEADRSSDADRRAGAGMAEAANRWLGSLGEELRDRATVAFEDAQRTHWHYVPNSDREGITLRQMNDEQRRLAHELLRASLSAAGYQKADTIMELESILKELENGGPRRDPLLFYWTVYDEPGAEGKWGLSVEGHHLSLNFVVVDGELVGATPAFFGANPAVVAAEKGDGDADPEISVRPLGEEETLAYDLLGALSEEQRSRAVVAEESPRDMRQAPEAQAVVSEPEGLPVSEMEQGQRDILRKLIETYVNNVPQEFARPYLKQVVEEDFDRLHFAWFGGTEPNEPHSYRVQGRKLLLVFFNTQHGPEGHPANHAHSVWRTIDGDFQPVLKRE